MAFILEFSRINMPQKISYLTSELKPKFAVFAGNCPWIYWPQGFTVIAVKRKKTLLKKFGRTVRRIRLSQGLSQEEFAIVAGLDRSYVGAIERGEQNPSLWIIASLANGLNVSLQVLVEDLG